MRSRWSPSVFDDTHVLTRDELRVLLLAAQWAPSFRQRTAGGFRGRRARQREPPGAGPAPVPRQLRLGAAASAVLIVGAQLGPDEAGEGGYKPFHAEYDTGQAAAHLTVQAWAMGLHAHQFAGFDKPAVADD